MAFFDRVNRRYMRFLQARTQCGLASTRVTTFETLEPRRLLAAITASIDSEGTLVVSGTDAGERITVVSKSGKIWATGMSQAHPLQSVQRIHLDAGGGDDLVFLNYVGTGQDRLTVDAVILGGDGNDRLSGGFGNDEISGGPGADRIMGNEGNDRLLGNIGNDEIFGQQGDDVIYGNAGSDWIVAGDGNDTVFGGDGGISNQTAGDGGDTIFGGLGDDRIYSDAGGDVVDGGSGNDLIFGGSGNDRLSGQQGDDHIEGGAGYDTIHGNAGRDLLRGGDHNDRIFGGHGGTSAQNLDDGNDEIDGGNGDDTIQGDNGNDFIRGGPGNDTLRGGAGNDQVFGEEGVDVVSGDEGDNIVSQDGRLGDVSSEWNVDRVSAPEVWARGFTGTGIIVAVIDSGTDLDHPEFAGNLWTNTKEIAQNGRDDDGNGYVDDIRGWDFVDNDADPQDGFWHGTHVAGIVAARQDGNLTSGVAPGASIMSLRVLTASGQGRWKDIAAALRYAANNGARVINLSLGGAGAPGSDFRRQVELAGVPDAIKYAEQKGVFVVAAAGNGAAATSNYVPAAWADAAHPNFIAVGSHDPSDRLSTFSNAGAAPVVQVEAPGEGIYSTALDSGSASKTGTSVATPHVAAIAALMLQANPQLRPADIRNYLVEGALRAISGSSNTGVDAAASVWLALHGGGR